MSGPESFSAKLRDETDLDTLSDDLLGVVRETMQPAQATQIKWLKTRMKQAAPQGLLVAS